MKKIDIDNCFELGFAFGVIAGAIVASMMIYCNSSVIKDKTGEITIKPNEVYYRLTLATDEQILKYEKGEK